MQHYKTIREDIENASNHEIVKKGSLSLPAVGLLAAGAVLAVGAGLFDDPNSSVPTFLYTAAGLLLLFGLVKLVMNRSRYMYRPTRSLLDEAVMYFDVHESAALQSCIEMRKFEDLDALKRIKDLGVRLEVHYAADGSFAAVQVSEYIPYSYEAVTPVVCCRGKEAAVLADYCRRTVKA